MSAAENPYPAFFKEIEDAQEARKTSLEARAAAIIGVSGAIVTLVFALAGLATKSSATFSLTKEAQHWLYASLIAFIASAVVAILGGLPLLYKTVLSDGLKWIMESAWSEAPEDAARRIGATRASNLGWNQRVNDIKAAVLIVALALQILGILFVSWAAWSILDAATLVK